MIGYLKEWPEEKAKHTKKSFIFVILFPDDVFLINHTLTCQARLVGERNFCLKHYTQEKMLNTLRRFKAAKKL